MGKGRRIIGSLEAFSGLPSPQGAAVQIVAIPVSLASIAGAGDVLTTYTPGFRFKVLSMDFAVEVVASTPGKAATLNAEIGTTNLTGGAIALTTANCTPLGAIIAGSAITANNVGGATDTLSIEAASVTAFGEGSGYILLRIQNLDTLERIAVVETSGVGNEVIGRAAAGGVRLTTQASTPADNDDAMIAGITGTNHAVLINANTKVHFHTAVAFPAITALVAAAGLNEEPDSCQPGDCSGDAAFFLFDPGEDVTTGLTTAQHANWIVVQVVAGSATYTATSIAVAVDQYYDLRIEYNQDRKPLFYIDGELVATGAAQTDAQTLRSHVGVETTAAAQKSIDIGFVDVSRALT